MTTIESRIRTPANAEAAHILSALGTGGIAHWHSLSIGKLLAFVEAGGVLTVPEFMRIMSETLKETAAEVRLLRELEPGAEIPAAPGGLN